MFCRRSASSATPFRLFPVSVSAASTSPRDYSPRVLHLQKRDRLLQAASAVSEDSARRARDSPSLPSLPPPSLQDDASPPTRFCAFRVTSPFEGPSSREASRDPRVTFHSSSRALVPAAPPSPLRRPSRRRERASPRRSRPSRAPAALATPAPAARPPPAPASRTDRTARPQPRQTRRAVATGSRRAPSATPSATAAAATPRRARPPRPRSSDGTPPPRRSASRRSPGRAAPCGRGGDSR
jgi:hypothetical protein